MNAKIEKYLIQSGWYEGRKVDISSCVQSFKEDNISLTKSAVSFIEEYYQLKIKIIAEFEKLKGKSITIDVNSCLYIQPEALELYNQHYNRTLITVGLCADYAMILLIDEDGKFYGANDQLIALIGNTFEEVLENMINGVINTREFIWDEIEDF
jgi:hypothetical protein